MSDDVLAATPEKPAPAKPLRRLLGYLGHSPSRLAAVVGLSFVGTLLALGGFIAMWYGGRVLAVAAQDAMYRLRREVFEHTQTLSLRFFDRQPIGDLMSRITNDLDSVNQLFDKGLYPAINSVFTLVITTVLMFIVSWQLSLAVILIAPIIVLMMHITSRYSGPAFAILQERTGALNGAAEELITGDRTVKATAWRREPALGWNSSAPRLGRRARGPTSSL